MKFLKHIRSRSKLKENNDGQQGSYQYGASGGRPATSRMWSHPQLPDNILELIFIYVCPLSLDESREPPETAIVADGCMLCDVRDLSKCAAVCRKWYQPAQSLLYHSIRIDAVHFCEREPILAEKRRKRSFFDRNADPKDAPATRLNMLANTLRHAPRLAVQVQLLKMPYMTRETCKADLARTVSVLPNLQYVDLPEGFFSGDASCVTLMQELQARCSEIKKMKYLPGSEPNFTMLAQRRHWQALEEIEISKVTLEPDTLVEVLASLPVLHHLQLSDLPWLDDSVFQLQQPCFPPLHTLSLSNLPRVTAEGLVEYVSRPVNAENLASLSLVGTGINTTHLHAILSRAYYLVDLSIVETVSRPFPHQEQIPPLQSNSLETLYFELTSSAETPAHTLHPPAESYYSYLSESLHNATLPNLSSLYVRDISFPELLVSTTPRRGAGRNARAGGGGGFAGTPNALLEIYTKGPEEVAWNFTSIPSSEPPRPQSFYSPSHGHSKSMNSMSASQNFGSQGFPSQQFSSPRSSMAPQQGFPSQQFSSPRSSLAPSFSNNLSPNDMPLPAPRAPFAQGGHQRSSSGSFGGGVGFGGGNDGLPRPQSSSSSMLAPPPPLNWGGRDARRSLVMTNGAGGFLAVPNEDEGRRM